VGQVWRASSFSIGKPALAPSTRSSRLTSPDLAWQPGVGAWRSAINGAGWPLHAPTLGVGESLAVCLCVMPQAGLDAPRAPPLPGPPRAPLLRQPLIRPRPSRISKHPSAAEKSATAAVPLLTHAPVCVALAVRDKHLTEMRAAVPYESLLPL
jgi:hypothetical protein